MKVTIAYSLLIISGQQAYGYRLPGPLRVHRPTAAPASPSAPACVVTRRDILDAFLATSATAAAAAVVADPLGAMAADSLGYEVERKLGGGPPVKEGDYVFCDYTAWLDGFDGATVVDSSVANGGQVVRMGIGAAEAGSPFSGLGGTAVAPVRVFVPPGIYEALASGAAPPGTMQADTPKYPDAATVGTKFRLVLPAAKAFGKSGGVSGLGKTVPPDATVYYAVRIRGKTNKASTGF